MMHYWRKVSKLVGLYSRVGQVIVHRNKTHILQKQYLSSRNTPNVWIHNTRPTKFCLCVDDFGVTYFTEADEDHLIQSLCTTYTITTDNTGSNFCGLCLDWDYTKRRVDIYMPRYIK